MDALIEGLQLRPTRVTRLRGEYEGVFRGRALKLTRTRLTQTKADFVVDRKVTSQLVLQLDLSGAPQGDFILSPQRDWQVVSAVASKLERDFAELPGRAYFGVDPVWLAQAADVFTPLVREIVQPPPGDVRSCGLTPSGGFVLLQPLDPATLTLESATTLLEQLERLIAAGEIAPPAAQRVDLAAGRKALDRELLAGLGCGCAAALAVAAGIAFFMASALLGNS